MFFWWVLIFCGPMNVVELCRELRNSVIVLVASASRTYIGLVLFRASVFTGTKLASGVPAAIGRFGPE